MSTAQPTRGTPPRFDVLLPYYGDVDLMKRAVASVLAQQGEDWLLTVLDDDYPDPSVERWVSALADPRICYIRNEQNLGTNGNFRQALNLASADFLIFMGCDDIMLPGYLDRMRSMMTTFPFADVIQPAVRIIDEHGVDVLPLTDRLKGWAKPRLTGPQILTGEVLARSVLRGNWTYFPSLCWRRSLIQGIGFRSAFEVVPDLALLLDVALAGGCVLVDDAVTFAYRRHRDSVSAVRARTGHRFEEEARFFDEAAEMCSANGWPGAARAARLHVLSRLHAVSLLPRTVRPAGLQSSTRLLRHAFAR